MKERPPWLSALYLALLFTQAYTMAKQFPAILPEHHDFIHAQKVFFVATAAEEGRINLSPKGMDTLRVTGPNELVWLNLTGSGNETAAHLLRNDRMTLMCCAFEGKPLILRLYGHAHLYHPRDAAYQEHIGRFPEVPGARQIIVLTVDLVQTSCGYAVPIMPFREERSVLRDWAAKQGEDRLDQYRQEKNSRSLDGWETEL
jgi:predicted pyridoxine 5'-phosphate oxidase superfamily flavin-nucleotide-binding protein